MIRRLASAGDDDDDLGLSLVFCIQTIDVILAWLIAEDDGAKAKIRSLLADQDQDFGAIKATIQEQLDGLDGEDDNQSSEAKEAKDMLATLVDFLFAIKDSRRGESRCCCKIIGKIRRQDLAVQM